MNLVIPMNLDPLVTGTQCIQSGVMNIARAISEADTQDRAIQIRRHIAARILELDALERLAFDRMETIDRDPEMVTIIAELQQLAKEQ